MLTDITERKRAEEIIKESEKKYRSIVETANEGIWIVDAELRTTYANKKLADILGYSQKEMIGRYEWDFVDDENKAAIKLILDERRWGIDGSYELKFIRKDGSPLWTIINDKPLFNDDGKFIGSLDMLTDITERKETEETLANIEIARKKEIHHRIKNNLQVISSLLDLQAEKFKGKKDIEDSEVLKAFRESQDRVISMALIHEELYEDEGDNKVNFSLYIKKLVENLFRTYRLGNTDISLIMDLEKNPSFDMDIAVPLGMIVNEIVSNSLKHAFPGRDRGEIRIKLVREETGESINCIEESKREDCSTAYVLSVSDNGVGIPKNIDIEGPNTLGLQLVTSLIDQLDGKLEVKRNNGIEFTIRFTVVEKDNQELRQLHS
jgi:PAS domain S-box-containing protein